MKLQTAPILSEPQPGLTLRDYQVKGADFVTAPIRKGRAYIADDMGIGKSAQGCEVIRRLRSANTLIIAPKIAHGVWQHELQQWLGLSARVFPTPLGKNKQYPFNQTQRITITNPEQLAKLIEHGYLRWTMIIVDEAHLFRNPKTLRFKLLKQLKSLYYLPLSGSPIVNGVYDVWTNLNRIAPDRFPSYWAFVREHCWIDTPDETGHSGTEVYGLRDRKTFKRATAPYIIRRLKTDPNILNELPLKTRQPLYIDLLPEQQAIYDDIANDYIYNSTTQDGAMETNVIIGDLPKQLRLLQTIVTPALFGGPNVSAGFDALKESIALDFDAGLNVIVFCPFSQALPLIADALRNVADHTPIIHGQIPTDERTRIIDEFQSRIHKRQALLWSIKTATSQTATAASVCYFLGFAWTAVDNIQAEDRMHRIGQTNPVLCRYIIPRGTVAEHVLDVIEEKHTWAQLALNAENLVKPFIER